MTAGRPARGRGSLARAQRRAGYRPLLPATGKVCMPTRSDGRAVGVAQLRHHPDGAKELASLVVEPGAREHGIATHMADALLASETVAVYALVDRRFVDHFARWGFRQAGPGELPCSVSRTYLIGRAVTTLGSLLRWQRIRIVPLLRPAR